MRMFIRVQDSVSSPEPYCGGLTSRDSSLCQLRIKRCPCAPTPEELPSRLPKFLSTVCRFTLRVSFLKKLISFIHYFILAFSILALLRLAFLASGHSRSVLGISGLE